MQVVSYDTETTGLDWHTNHSVFAFSTSDENGVIDVCRLDGSSLRRIQSKKKLSKLWRDNNIIKVMHNAIFDIPFTEKVLGFSLNGAPIHDTLIMSKLLQNRKRHGLKQLTWELAGIPTDDESDIKRYIGNDRNYSHVPEKLMDRYQQRDAERTMLLYKFFWPMIQEDTKLLEIYNLEISMIWATLRTERRGLMLDENLCRQMVDDLIQRAKVAQETVSRIAGKQINPHASKDVSELLFGKLRLPSHIMTKKMNNPSTAKDALMELRATNPHPAIDAILACRSYTRGATTLASYLDCSHGGIIYPNINTMGALTGRESISNPNLQNVAKEDAASNLFPIPARKVFKPRFGYVNFHNDYSSIEIRLIAHYSNDAHLIQIIKDGEDPHMAAAAAFYGDVLNSADENLRKSMRTVSKSGQYAVAYGAGAKKLASVLQYGDGKESLRRYRQSFPGVADLATRIIRDASANGYVRTAFGRKIHCDPGKAYKSVNYLIQGTAADVLKYGYTRVDAYLQTVLDGLAGIILPVHDELVIEFPRKHLNCVQDTMKEVFKLMTAFPELNVPMDVESAISTVCWADTKEWKIDK